MLGVAIPGIAPLRPGEATAPATPRVASPSPVAATLPAAAAAPSMPAAVVSAAEPAAEIPTPVPPKIAAKGGVPLAAVALLAGALVLVGGLAITWLWRSAPPIAAQARSSADGSDVLVLQCDPRSCKDGTVVEAAGSKATFVAGKAELTLAEPMHIGDNHLSLRIDRPGFGRDEVVSMVVPVAYRVRADVSPMRDDPPRIAVDVEALPQSHVVVGDRTVALDARGIGQTVVDETAATTGPADESRAVVVDFPYTVTPPGQPPATGTVSARVSVAPLRVDAPGEHAIVEGDALVVAGRAAKGASITVDGKPVEAAADGSFETTVALPALGERVVDVRAGTATLAPRHVRIVADRVASLAAEAKRLEGRATPGYDAVMADVAAHVGQAMVVEGEVIESRTLGHRTVALVDDRRGCARGPCLVRVVLSQNVPLERGRTARAFGSVARGYSPSPGQTVPELDADFVLQSKR